jgi:hypothetical protein
LAVHPHWHKLEGTGLAKFARQKQSVPNMTLSGTGALSEGPSDGELDMISQTVSQTVNTHSTTRSSGYHGMLEPFIGLPSSPQRVSWDLVGAVLIMYDIFAIPLTTCFDPPDNIVTTTIDWFALIFWTLNIFNSLTVAYVEEGKHIMDPRMILRNYLKFWFWVDIAVVGPDWAITIAATFLGASGGAGKSVKLLRILRLARCMRILRLAKLKTIIASIKDLIDNEAIDILFNIVKMLMCLIAVNHFIACAWFAMTLFDAGPSWVEYHSLERKDVSWIYQYVTAFHWAITQFTPASMHVQPQNVLERTFAIVVVVLGLVGFSYLVGSITGSLTELRRMKEEGSKQFWNLRRFLKKSNVQLTLRVKIEKYLEHAWQLQKSALNGEIPILKLLTEQLKNELNCALHSPHIEVHPLFKYMNTHYPIAIQRITTKALSVKFLNHHELYFSPGELAQHLSFVVRGRLKYIKMAPGQKEPHNEFVDQGEDWITEPALWTPEWITLGDLTSERVSELLELSSEEFAKAMKRSPQVFSRVCTYAANFIEWLKAKDERELSDICQGDIIGETEVARLLFGPEDTGRDSIATSSGS